MAAPSAELAHNAVELPAAILDELGVRAGDLVRLRGKRRTTVAVVVAVKRFVCARRISLSHLSHLQSLKKNSSLSLSLSFVSPSESIDFSNVS